MQSLATSGSGAEGSPWIIRSRRATIWQARVGGRWLAAFVLALTFVSCDGGPERAKTSSPSAVSPTTIADATTTMSPATTVPQQPMVNHQTRLSPGESAFLARYLTPVDGYSYVDADDFEINGAIALFDSIEAELDYDLFGAISLHSVVADDPSQNTARTQTRKREVGFLGLVQFNEVVPAGGDEQVASNAFGGTPIDRLEISGVTVFVFENTNSVDSRYTYNWLQHGTQAFIDGADREPLERWIAAYLEVPKLAPNETIELEALLTPVDGFTYADFDTAVQPEIDDTLGQYSYSAHLVADTEESIGVLLLVDSDDQSPFAVLMDLLGFEWVDTYDVDEITVEYWASFDDPDLEFIEWTQDGYHAGLATNVDDTDASDEFLVSFWFPNG